MLHRFETGYVRFNQAMIGLMMAMMFVLVFTNVVTRYGFGFSIAWADEVASFLMIWVTFLGPGWRCGRGGTSRSISSRTACPSTRAGACAPRWPW